METKDCNEILKALCQFLVTSKSSLSAPLFSLKLPETLPDHLLKCERFIQLSPVSSSSSSSPQLCIFSPILEAREQLIIFQNSGIGVAQPGNVCS